MSAARFWEQLETAGKMVAAFEREFGRTPTDVDYKIAFTLFAENGQPAPKANASRPARKPQASGGGDGRSCPKCGGPMWDNRAKKASGEFNPKSPDYSCKDKQGCGHGIWLKDEAKAATQGGWGDTSEPAEQPWEAEQAEQEESLPFS